MSELRTCTKCKLEKPLSDFPIDRRRVDGHTSQCKLCRNAHHRVARLSPERRAKEIEYQRAYSEKNRALMSAKRAEWRKNPENREKDRAASRRSNARHWEKRSEWHYNWRQRNRDYTKSDNLKRYGIDIPMYKTLCEFQGHVCAICGTHRDDMYRDLGVDHCHATGVIRGLLCNTCNSAIGLLKDSPKNLENAIKYLTDHPLKQFNLIAPTK